MESTNIQVSFFNHIKSILPPHLSFVDEVAELLNISNDSAYRRIRGEKPITLDEVERLSSHFKISLDQFLHLQTDSFIFSGNLADSKNFVFEKWMEAILGQMKYMNSFTEKHLYYLTKDLPFYQPFQIPELAAFKYFFWRKSILHYEEMRGVKFTVKNLDPLHEEIGKKIVEVYNEIPSTEIWNIESINSTIRQIEFYRESKVFQSAEDAQCLYDKIALLIDHMEKEAELGAKFAINSSPKPNAGSFTMLVNEVMLGDNTFHAVLDGKRITYLNHSVINFVGTKDERFTAYMQGALENLIRKSTQISVTGEKERSRFFNRLRDKIKLSARL